MRKVITIALELLSIAGVSAQSITQRIHRLDEVVVTANRPMKDIGVQNQTTY